MKSDKFVNDVAEYADEFIKFINKTYSVFHAADNARTILETKEYTKLEEKENWVLKAGGKYYFQRNGTATIAFTIGSNFKEDDTGFKIVCCHMDSPCLQISPVSKLKQGGYNQACIQTYGGGLWHTWTDRDLNVGGKIIYYDDNAKQYITKLWNSKKPLMKVNNLAIHLQSAVENAAFTINPETQLRPIFSTEAYDIQEQTEKDKSSTTPVSDKHYDKLINMICTDLQINKTQIIDMELQLSDAQQGGLVGTSKEFVSAQRIDDLICSFAALKAFETNSPVNKKFVDIIALFDHEEIGSVSAHGAKSTLISDTISRIFKGLTPNLKIDLLEKAKAQSFIVSADVTHSVHPNYLDRYQVNHQCLMNKGICISFDPGQAFASSLIGRTIIYELCKRLNVPLQEFIKKNDQSSGSTLGPGLSALCSIRTADLGPALLGMHSIRETSGTLDTYNQYVFIKGFFDEYEKININSIVNS